MFVTGNRYLTRAEMEKNALYIWDYLSYHGWSINAVAGMLGNMQTESTINPGIWQSLKEGNLSGGFGLVQWTPATKYLDFADEYGMNPGHMDTALWRIEWELENNVQYYSTSAYPISFREFKTSTLSPYYLAGAFLYNYERPKSPNAIKRGNQATEWYNFLVENGATPVTPTPSPTPKPRKRNMSLLMMYMATKRVK